MTRITSTLAENLRTVMILFCSVLLRMRRVSGKSCRENRNSYITSNTHIQNM